MSLMGYIPKQIICLIEDGKSSIMSIAPNHMLLPSIYARLNEGAKHVIMLQLQFTTVGLSEQAISFDNNSVYPTTKEIRE